MAKSAIEQLKADKQPKIVTNIPAGFPAGKAAAGGTMVVSTPQEVNGLMRRVPEGRLIMLAEVRNHLAKKYGANIACPVSTAIFINVAARAADEERMLGDDSDPTPYWRTLKTDGLLNDKYPGGAEAHKARLEAEGLTISQGKRGYMVANYKDYLFEL